jgi:hypothetical protein
MREWIASDKAHLAAAAKPWRGTIRVIASRVGPGDVRDAIQSSVGDDASIHPTVNGFAVKEGRRLLASLRLGRVDRRHPPHSEAWAGIGNQVIRRRRAYVDIAPVDNSPTLVHQIGTTIAAALSGVIWIPSARLLVGPGRAVFGRPAQRQREDSSPLAAEAAYFASRRLFEDGDLEEAEAKAREALEADPASTRMAEWYRVVSGYRRD